MLKTKNAHYFEITIFIIISLSFSFTNETKKNFINFGRAIDKGMISASVSGLGGHSGECIKVDLLSAFLKDTIVRIEPGWIFESADTNIQDILIVKEKTIPVMAKESASVKGYGFCCQASKRSPFEKAVFNTGRKADTIVVKLAEHLNAHDYSPGVMQHAIWVLTDSHDLSSVHSENKEEQRKLHKFMSVLLDIDIPWYTIAYTEDTSVVFSDKPEALQGEIEYEIWNNTLVSLVIRYENRQVVSIIFEKKPHNPGKYTKQLNIDVRKFPKGQYSIHLITEESELLRKKFEL
jgi:hypothetical protein